MIGRSAALVQVNINLLIRNSGNVCETFLNICKFVELNPESKTIGKATIGLVWNSSLGPLEFGKIKNRAREV